METGLDLNRLSAIIAEQVARKLKGKDANMRAWVYDRGKSWYVGWRDPDGRRFGKSCGQGAIGKRLAVKEQERINAELVTGIYGSNKNKTWAEFRADYSSKIVQLKARATQTEIESALDAFQRLISPTKMAKVDTSDIDKFTACRSDEESKRTPGEKVAPATVNKELRHIKAALRKARKWTYIDKEPDFEMIREVLGEPTYVAPDQFAAIYVACEKARIPTGLPYSPGEWWKGLIITAYMTGWRIGQLLALRREDMDLDAGEAVSQASTAKGKRHKRKPLHPVVVDHLRRLTHFSKEIFPWPNHRRTLDKEFHFLCGEAKVPRFGFHDLRRGFATMNAERMTADALQDWMEHASYLTTKRYIAVARQLRPAMGSLFVPDVSRSLVSPPSLEPFAYS